MSTLEQTIKSIIDYVDGQREQMISMLREVVNIESPTEHPEGVNQVAIIFREQLEQIGFKTEYVQDEGYGNHVLGNYEVPGARRVLMMGHMDTVFPLGTGWGFSMDEARAYGPGVIDMKSGDLTALFAVK